MLIMVTPRLRFNNNTYPLQQSVRLTTQLRRIVSELQRILNVNDRLYAHKSNNPYRRLHIRKHRNQKNRTIRLKYSDCTTRCHKRQRHAKTQTLPAIWAEKLYTASTVSSWIHQITTTKVQLKKEWTDFYKSYTHTSRPDYTKHFLLLIALTSDTSQHTMCPPRTRCH